MRYLIPIVNLLTTSLRPLVSVSISSSRTGSFSLPPSSPSPHHIEVSNETTLITNLTAGWLVRRGEPPSSGTFVYRILPSNFIPLKPQESRTLCAIPPTKTYGEIPAEVDLLTVLYLGLWSGTWMTTIPLFYFFSLSEIWEFSVYAIKLISFHLMNLSLLLLFFLYDSTGFVIVWIDQSVDVCFFFLVRQFDSVVLYLECLQDRWRKKGEAAERLKCLKNTEKDRRAHRIVQRPSGQRSAPRLFFGQEDEYIHHLYLPEEQLSPIRHMQDPRYFNHLEKLNHGSFGSIHLVEHRITGKKMAMKTLARKKNPNYDINVEVRALLRLRDKVWCPKVLSTFMDPNNIYIVMTYYSRGSVNDFMKKSGGCVNRTLATFYMAEILLAIQEIHKAGIIHRDIKSGNVLLDDDGHVVIADYGVSRIFPANDEDEDPFMEDEYPLWVEMKQVGGDGFPLLPPSIDNPHLTTQSFGTPFYAAPEVLRRGKEYSYGIDYYSMGVMYFEMVTGYLPVRLIPGTAGARPEEQFELDLERQEVHLQLMSASDLDFLYQVLDPDPYERPMVKRMKEHQIFAGIDWEKLSRRELPVPPLRSPIRRRGRRSSSSSRER